MDPKSLTVSFLRNSCGFSLKLAVSASKKLKIENIENPNSVLDLLRTHGLEQNHIRYLISSRPLLLSADLANTLKPNMELFKSLGFCGASLAKMLSKYPTVLESDAYTVVEFFRARGFSDKQIKTLTMKRPALYTYNANKTFKPKLEFFKSLGFNRFSEIVSDIMNLGFEPNCRQFVLAIGSMALNTKTSWGQKVEAFRSSGMSEDEIYAAFKRQPLCMSCSEKKIKKMMGFFVNKLKMKPSRISKTPILIQFSFEKRIIPRCSVLF
ncbi:transcription termination factor MTEF1, chloroplastic-like [Carya illinoinensis]|uniref:transcription termination factor MTEF1, chloroplastic-like n=1 Tax=Carya illinoinensis TaxID=32201 RepID=UPI001C7198F6|nr:transcription termination factor MTEF1, chloroplastic-like [Carya illinoinensis]